MFQQVAIVGLGLIGGSLGLALRQAHAAQWVVGFDPGYGVSEQARRMGAIDQGGSTLGDTVRGAELVILATPVGTIHALLQDLAHVAEPGAVITDVASTKSQVMSWAEEFLPSGVSFVGGHPMAGKEVSGIEAADPALFQRCVYCLTPTSRTSHDALKKVMHLIEIVGARVRFLEPAEHDKQVAQISHLPYLVSSALMQSVAQSSDWSAASQLASSGFRDATRLAAGNPTMHRDICLTNREAVLHALDEYLATLHLLREQIATRDPHLKDTLRHTQQLRQEWQHEYEADILQKVTS